MDVREGYRTGKAVVIIRMHHLDDAQSAMRLLRFPWAR
jgi:hypothetical protein